MRSRALLVIASCGFVVLGLACVDLFHDTDFDTLCTSTPSDPACASDAAAAPDAVVDASVDATVPHPDFCAWTSSQAKDQAVRACAWLGACEGTIGESSFGACTIDAQLAYDCSLTPSLRPRGNVDAFWACLATVKSCGDVDRCVFPGGVQECNLVTSGSFSGCGANANSGVRLECAGPAGRARGIEPCAMVGKTCSPEDNSVATCSGTLGFACTKSGCSGTSRVDCKVAGSRMLDRGNDCAGTGAGRCDKGDAGPYCALGSKTTACAPDSPPSCEANNIVNACIGGATLRLDCGVLGLNCNVSQLTSIDPTSACMVTGSGSCNPGSDTCESENRLHSCGRGAFFDVDCASVGLGKCVVNTAGHGACTRPAN